MKKEKDTLVPELTRPLKVDHVPLGGIVETIVASPSEREALTGRFGILSIERLEAEIHVDRADGGMFDVTGHLSADVTQACVVTLEPVAEKIEEEISLLFAPPHLIEDERDGSLGDVGDADPPEPIENGMIDLGEVAAQQLAMALNPYPRKKGATFEYKATEKIEAPIKEAKHSPFEVLKGWKK